MILRQRTYDTPKEPHEAPALMLISPAILTMLVLVFGFFPNVLSGTIIDPAAMSIMAIYPPFPICSSYSSGRPTWH